MKLNSKYLMPAVAIAGSLTLTGCSTKTLSEEEINEFTSYVYNQTISSDFDFYDFKKNISETIPKIGDKDIASDIVNDYIYMLYQETNKYTSFFNIIGEELDSIKKRLNIEKIDVSMYDKISKESKVIGAIFEEMSDKSLIVIEEKGYYGVDVDIDKVITEFKDYLTDDLIDFMKFRIEENNNSVYDINTDKYNVPLILERAHNSITQVEENPKSSQVNNWKSSAVYYLQLLLAEYTSQFLDTSDIDVKKISQEYLSELKECINEYKDTTVYKHLSTYIKLLEDNDFDIDATAVAEFRLEVLDSIYPIEEQVAEYEDEVNYEDIEE